MIKCLSCILFVLTKQTYSGLLCMRGCEHVNLQGEMRQMRLYLKSDTFLFQLEVAFFIEAVQLCRPAC